jgi:Bacterial Ig-like domain
VTRSLAVALLFLFASGTVDGQTSMRRLTTVAAIRQFPGFFHLQNVLLRGQFVENGSRVMLRANDQELRAVLKDVSSRSGAVEVRGQIVDVGRLEPGDPRVTGFAEGRDADHWPKPGEELLLNVTAVAEAQPATTPSVRALALEPWKFDGQTVTLLGNFRGRNLFGDLPDAPGKSRYDFVLRGAEGALWISGLRPRGKGFDLDVDRRIDSDKWVQITGMVTENRGLAIVTGKEIALGKAPQTTPDPSEDNAGPAAPPPPPVEVVFSSPTADETDVSPSGAVRIQFSRGLQPSSIPEHFRATYVGAPPDAAPLMFKVTYDAATRAIEIRFAQPLERFRTVKIEVLDGLKAFDGAPAAPWSLTFSVGG